MLCTVIWVLEIVIHVTYNYISSVQTVLQNSIIFAVLWQISTKRSRSLILLSKKGMQNEHVESKHFFRDFPVIHKNSYREAIWFTHIHLIINQHICCSCTNTIYRLDSEDYIQYPAKAYFTHCLLQGFVSSV